MRRREASAAPRDAPSGGVARADAAQPSGEPPGEPDRETGRRHPLERDARRCRTPLTAVDLEPDVDDGVGAVFLGFAVRASIAA